MAQVFSPRLVLPLELSALALLVMLTALLFAWRAYIEPMPALDEASEQPIPFSHKHHVSDDGIDCRFCHASVETGAFAGMPSTELCLGCHSQLFRDAPLLRPLHESLASGRPIHWNRVHDLPDFVYFDHSIHLSKGVGCQSCHGPVERMPLMRRTQSLQMQWCLDCHRAPQKALRPPDRLYDMDWQPTAQQQQVIGGMLMHRNAVRSGHITQCSICHR